MSTLPDAATLPGPRAPALRALTERGFVEDTSDAAAVDALLSGGMATFYVGYDPTAPSLHVGHLVQILAMRQLQRHGHRPIVVVGGGTAMVGDPSGKTESRKLLDDATIAENVAALRRQFSRFLHFDRGVPHDAILVDNAAWLRPLHYVEFLRDIGVHFTVNRMIATKTYRDRLDAEQPLSFLEFNYQLLQAYDFLHLFRSEGCRLQVGGSDQWGNMIAGVELIRRVAAGERGSAQCLTTKLLTTSDGKKMGKTERGAVWLDPERLSAFDYYQYWVGVDDRDVGRLLRLFTDLDLAAIATLEAAEGAELNAAKRVLAREATAMLHGESAADAAAAAAVQAFGGGDDWSAVPEVQVPLPAGASGVALIDVLVHPAVAAFKSKREARQRLEAGAVRIAGEAVVDPAAVLEPAAMPSAGFALQAGKKLRLRVRLVAASAEGNP
jgi:tyrosyl-tRNA synthetase